VLVVHNDIVRAIDDGHVASLALLDLSSAFDSVDHSTLLSVLRSRFSVTEQSGSFHTIQVFTTNSGHTHPIPLTSGVPRLESWSGTIYLIQRMYNQFLFLTLRSIPHTDDTQSYIHCAISEIPALVRCPHASNDLAKSYASLRLQLKPAKTEFILFGSRVNLTRIPQRFRSIQV